MLDEFTLKVSLLTGFLVLVFLLVSRYPTGDPVLDAIPTIGFSDPILSYLSAVRYSFDCARMINEGYKKTRPGLFKIANFQQWMVLATGSELVNDIRKAPDDVLSRAERINDLVQPEYTLDLPTAFDTPSSNVIRSKLTRDTAGIFNEVHEELIMAVDDLIPTHGHEWTKVPIEETFQRVICRASNRIFVGAPLCRDHDYQTLNISSTTYVIKFGFFISLLPKPLKPIISRMLSSLPAQIQGEIEFIRPMFEERFAKMEEYDGDWDDKPNDLLMWLMSEVPKVERSVEGIARRMLLINLAAIHTSSATIAQLLYRLLSNPEYMEPLRKEVDIVTREEGWTKAGIDKMYQIDSFLRETQRLDGVTTIVTSRFTLRPFTFSNGVTIPAGTLVSVPSRSIHGDERIHPNPDVFDGYRSTKLRESDGDTTSRYHAVATSNEHMPFGVGRHACPGRFFVVDEIKALFAYIVATYDIKFEEGKGVPGGWCLAEVRWPGNTNLMFRARQK